jgi:hypothetical protein
VHITTFKIRCISLQSTCGDFYALLGSYGYYNSFFISFYWTTGVHSPTYPIVLFLDPYIPTLCPVLFDKSTFKFFSVPLLSIFTSFPFYYTLEFCSFHPSNVLKLYNVTGYQFIGISYQIILVSSFSFSRCYCITMTQPCCSSCSHLLPSHCRCPVSSRGQSTWGLGWTNWDSWDRLSPSTSIFPCQLPFH